MLKFDEIVLFFYNESKYLRAYNLHRFSCNLRIMKSLYIALFRKHLH